MVDLKEIDWAISQLENTELSYMNCIKLASLYTIRNQHNFSPIGMVSVQADTEFLHTVQGKPTEAILGVMDELMNSLQVISPKIYQEVLEKLQQI